MLIEWLNQQNRNDMKTLQEMVIQYGTRIEVKRKKNDFVYRKSGEVSLLYRKWSGQNVHDE